MTGWWDGRAVLLDTETDGKEPTDARIITACLAYVNPGSQTEVDTWLLKPERDIPAEASEIHGVSTEHAAAHGVDRAEAITEIAHGLVQIHRSATREQWKDVPIIGHNVRFDLTVLDREMRRLGVGSLGHERGMVTVRIDGRQVGAFRVIDTMVIDKAVDPYRKGPAGGGRNRLTTVAEFYGVPIRGDAHTADADALAAGRVAWAIAKRCAMTSADLYDFHYRDRRDPQNIIAELHVVGQLSLAELHHRQIQWACDQAISLSNYFATSGKGDPNSVSTHWPIEPVPVDETVETTLI